MADPEGGDDGGVYTLPACSSVFTSEKYCPTVTTRSDFRLEVHKKAFSDRPAGSLQSSSGPLAGFRGREGIEGR